MNQMALHSQGWEDQGREGERKMEKEQKEHLEKQQDLEKQQHLLLEKALGTLHEYILELAVQAGEDREYGETLWQEICGSAGLLQELAYYHDYGEFLCRYQVAGYTLADVLVWQVDHFKLYMDRPMDMNRYRRERLLLAAFHTLARLEKEPASLTGKIQAETGQDIP